MALAPRLTNCWGSFLVFSSTFLRRNKLMTESQREAGKTEKENQEEKKKETRFPLPIHLCCSFPSLGFFLIRLFSPSLFFFRQRKWPWRVGRLWAEASQSRFEERGRRSKTSCWISDCMRGRRVRVHAFVCVRARNSGGLSAQVGPDTGVGFRGCLGNEAETIPLTPFLRRTGKVTLGS